MKPLDEIKICVVGLGYVGLPLACLFASRYPVVGLDIDAGRMLSISEGDDRTGEVSKSCLESALKSGMLRCVNNVAEAAGCNVYIVTVPTPVDCDNRPDLSPLINASRMVGSVLKEGDVVIYESTVYPGVTEEVCVPVLREASMLPYNEGFFVGYSPERVNPGDREHSVETICKVTSGSTEATADFVDRLYDSVLKGGTHRASSIRVAEASKIVENCQRDVNIAFMNELAKIFAAMGIDTGEVLAAAATKWNFINMSPGLVGGHCIGVDPYYMIEKAQVYGVLPRVMYNARRLNDGMGAYVAEQWVHQMNLAGLPVKDARILLLGFTFKENCPDMRNTKVSDIYQTLRQYTTNITVYDPWADASRARQDYGIDIVTNKSEVEGMRYDGAILAVAHRDFLELDIRQMVPSPGVVYDVKRFLPRDVVTARL